MQWYYAKNGQQNGPVSQEQLGELLRSGELQPTNLVWTQGLTEWAPMQRVPQLAPLFQTPVQAAPPAATTEAPFTEAPQSAPQPTSEAPAESSEPAQPTAETPAASEPVTDPAPQQPAVELERPQEPAPASEPASTGISLEKTEPSPAPSQPPVSPSASLQDLFAPAPEAPASTESAPTSPEAPPSAPAASTATAGAVPATTATATDASGEKIPNYLWQSIVTMLLCCPPLGIVSLLFSIKVNSSLESGDLQAARDASAKAKQWLIVTIIAGILLSVLVIIGSVVVVAVNR